MTDGCARSSLVQWLQQPVRWLWSGVRHVGRLAGNSGAAPDDMQARTNELLEALVAAQLRTTDLIGAIGASRAPDAPAELRDQIDALRREVELLTLASAPTHARLEDLADSVAELKDSLQNGSFATLEQRLHQAVVAQERTNQLLEDALRAGLDEHERARGV
jgi:hypothetical protein